MYSRGCSERYRDANGGCKGLPRSGRRGDCRPLTALWRAAWQRCDHLRTGRSFLAFLAGLAFFTFVSLLTFLTGFALESRRAALAAGADRPDWARRAGRPD